MTLHARVNTRGPTTEVATRQRIAAPAAAMRGSLPARIAQLQRTYGNRSIGRALSGFALQRVFTYGGEKIGEKRAEPLAKRLYARLAGPRPKMTESEFVDAVRGLAESDFDYGPLDDVYFAELIKNGRIQESFELKRRDRRLWTSITTKAANYPPERSQFFTSLSASENNERDFSYANLREMVEKFVKKHELSEEQFSAAIEQGVEQYRENGQVLAVNPDYRADLVLLVQHLLNYQNFNLGHLKDLPKNEDENAFRANEMAKSQWMLTQNPQANYGLLLPPTPVWGSGESVSNAMATLIDLNRPVKNSILGGETYKAVFLLARQLYKSAFQEAEKARTARGEGEQTEAVRFREQRTFFNPSLFSIVGQMNVANVTAADVQDVEEEAADVPMQEDVGGEGSEELVGEVKDVVPQEQEFGQTFMTTTLGFPWNEQEESFDEGSDYQSSSELESDEELYKSDENIFIAAAKRKRALNAVGLLAKISSQKAVIDEPDEQTARKHGRMRRRLDRQTEKLSNRYAVRYKHIAAELTYLNGKKRMIDTRIRAIDREHETLEFFADDERKQTGMSQRLRGIKKAQSDFPILEEVREFNTSTKGVRASTRAYKDQLDSLRTKLWKRASGPARKSRPASRRSKPRNGEPGD